MKHTTDLATLRESIDALDQQLLRLLSERAQLALAVKKAKGNSPVYNPAREATIIRELIKQNQGPLPASSIRAIFAEIIGANRNLERQLIVAYLGPEGTYSHEAAQAMFGTTCKFISELTLQDVLHAAETGAVDIAFLPIENSSEGAVIETHRLLLSTPLKISGELTLPIRHCLLSKARNLQAIKTVHAHSQALGQCREWLQINLPNAQLVSESSNAQAALVAGKDAQSAAIASKLAGTFADLPVLMQGINDFADNQTRFIALTSYSPDVTAHDKTSIICTVGDKVGALHELLGIFVKHGISLTRLESQPQPDHVYAFYIDFEGHKDTPEVTKALEELKQEAKTCKILGSYPQEEQRAEL